MTDSLTRRQALGLLTAPLVAGACGFDRILRPDHAIAATDTLTLFAAGDVHARRFNAAQETGAFMRGLLDSHPGSRVIVLGDLAGDKGLPEEFANYDLHWGSFRDRTLPIPGNHEYKADGIAQGYFDYWNGTGNFDGPAGPRDRGYYARQLTPQWRGLFLNDNSAELRAEQVGWLEREMSGHPGMHWLACFHKPMFASLCDHDTNLDGEPDRMAVPAQQGPWWDVLQQHGCRLALVGHVHRYERHAKLLRDGTVSSAGIRQLMVGTGGGIHMPVAVPKGQVRWVGWGALKLVLMPGKFTWELMPMEGPPISESGMQFV